MLRREFIKWVGISPISLISLISSDTTEKPTTSEINVKDRVFVDNTMCYKHKDFMFKGNGTVVGKKEFVPTHFDASITDKVYLLYYVRMDKDTICPPGAVAGHPFMSKYLTKIGEKKIPKKTDQKKWYDPKINQPPYRQHVIVYVTPEFKQKYKESIKNSQTDVYLAYYVPVNSFPKQNRPFWQIIVDFDYMAYWFIVGAEYVSHWTEKPKIQLPNGKIVQLGV